MNLVLDDTIRIPVELASSLRAFRRWTKSDDYPERGEIAWLRGELWVDYSMETLLHNVLKLRVLMALSVLLDADPFGRVFADGMRLVNEEAELSNEPDLMFVSREGIRTKRVRVEAGEESLEVIGSPDMVLEVVSEHSIQKDTVVLRDLYAAAGIQEYWLINPLGDQVAFDILRLTSRGYAATRKSAGWVKSNVFGKSFRLEEQPSQDDLPEYRLRVR